MTRVSVYVIVVSALLVTAGAAKRYYTEITHLAWHARHGFHAEIGGIRVHVPLSWEAEDPHGAPSLDMIRLPGHFWQGFGSVSISFWKLPPPEAEEAAAALLQKKGFRIGEKRTKVEERTAVFAGKPGKCVEYISAFDDSRINKLIRESDMRNIECRFGSNVSVELIGSANLKDDVYDIIQTAEPVQKTN